MRGDQAQSMVVQQAVGGDRWEAASGNKMIAGLGWWYKLGPRGGRTTKGGRLRRGTDPSQSERGC
jgi:hypothetical protein